MKPILAGVFALAFVWGIIYLMIAFISNDWCWLADFMASPGKGAIFVRVISASIWLGGSFWIFVLAASMAEEVQNWKDPEE